MLATPLLAALSETFPEARFDWAVSQWARPAISGNPRLDSLIDTKGVEMADGTWDDVQALIDRLRPEEYDTCFIPSRSSLLSYIAWQAGIPQRIGLDIGGRGFAHTLPVKPPKDEWHEAKKYLAIASALGIEGQYDLEFHPADKDRSSVTERLLEGIGWDGVMPLVILHPGGGNNPSRPDETIRWPAERFALLGRRIMRQYGALVVIVGSEQDRELVETVIGFMSATAANLAGELSLGELGALCEMADLYVGNDTGPTQVAAAVGCPTVAIFGPTDPRISGPIASNGKIRIVRTETSDGSFSWVRGVTAEEALIAVDQLLGLPPDHISPATSPGPGLPA